MLKILPALALLWAAVAAPGADAPATFKVGEFTFTRPAKWEWVESTQAVVRAKLQLGAPPTAESRQLLLKGAQVLFTYEAPRPGGGPKSNADRTWDIMIGPNYFPRHTPTETNVAGHKVSYVNARPAAEVGKPRKFAAQRPASLQIFALVESKEGNVLVTLTGATELVDASEADFRKMIESAAAGK